MWFMWRLHCDFTGMMVRIRSNSPNIAKHFRSLKIQEPANIPVNV